ncbi:MAG: [FeFe] hydrogenase H-cluster radical SAM maturase HydE [Gammaproteobacteria bacterium]|nr:[FeFe] hydrogenase H-cluster radical SAM maturase HydE [Gammaproteobacteria bacterium]
MCYAIPAKLVAIEGDKGIVDYFGEQRKVLLDLDDVKIGDYIFAQGGVMVRKIPEDEAQEILKTWKDIFFELKKTDEVMSKINTENMPENALAILQKINLRQMIKKDEMHTLLELTDPNELKVLYEIANHVRQREHGNASCVHGIIEFSNYCAGNCHYCGIRHDKNIPRYRMSIDEIIAAAKDAVDTHGFKALVLQSGEDYWYDDEKLITIVKAVRKLGTLVFVSCGSRSKETYKKLYEAGARAALMRFETSNPDVFATLRPGTTLADRIQLIKYLKEIGYVIATGFIIGLPGTTTDDLVNDILLTKVLSPDMYSFGPLIPTEDTPLASTSMVTKDLVLKTIAVSRFVDSNSNILVTTALETLDVEGRKEGLLAGANSLMLNITPMQYRKLYAIYDGKVTDNQEVTQSIQDTVDLLYSLGRAPTDIGFSCNTNTEGETNE